jgi:cytochrome c oxidase subunit 2
VTTAANRGAQQPAAPADGPPSGYVFPKELLPDHTVPKTPIPADLTFDDNLLAQGDAARGKNYFLVGACAGCHAINGDPVATSTIGPNLTHIATRHTIGSGLFPNDAPTLARWIKNAPKMKPGVTMLTIGRGEYNPTLKTTVTQGGLTDAQIADVVAYLMSLK